MNIVTPSCFRNIRIVASNSKPATTNPKAAIPALGKLMPYATAAKAIFVRANGEAAYYLTTGIAREANDTTAGKPGKPARAIRKD